MCFLHFALPLRLGQREGKVPEQFTDTSASISCQSPSSKKHAAAGGRHRDAKTHVSCACGEARASSASAAFSMICLISLNDKEQNVQMNMSVCVILLARWCTTQALMGGNVSHVGKGGGGGGGSE